MDNISAQPPSITVDGVCGTDRTFIERALIGEWVVYSRSKGQDHLYNFVNGDVYTANEKLSIHDQIKDMWEIEAWIGKIDVKCEACNRLLLACGDPSRIPQDVESAGEGVSPRVEIYGVTCGRAKRVYVVCSDCMDLSNTVLDLVKNLVYDGLDITMEALVSKEIT
jgi:hypothetical protein